MYKAALIDMDGFLINSEEIYLEANKIYFRKYDFDFTEELHRQGTGRKFEKWITTVAPLNKPGDVILRERNIIFNELMNQRLELLDGAKEFLSMLHKNFKTALVTSTQREYVDNVFEKTEIAHFFDIQITGDMVSHGKPDPECYVTAAKKLGVKPFECLVFEDAPTGILAGKAAGMSVVAVPSPFVKGHEVFTHADLVFNNLREITLAKLQKYHS